MSSSKIDSLVRPAPPTSLPANAAEALLALADDELVIGHRHSEWLGLSPFLEEDLTLSSIAQDEFGHARGLYSLIWPDWADREAGVTRRPASAWRSCELVELPGNPWEYSLVRHLLYDLAEPLRWNGLAEQYDAVVPRLAAFAQTALAEERFHSRHAINLFVRLGNDPVGIEKLQPHLESLFPLVSALTNGMTPDGVDRYIGQLNETIASTQCQSPFLNWQPIDAPRTKRSVAFEEIQTALLDVVAYDPDATW